MILLFCHSYLCAGQDMKEGLRNGPEPLGSFAGSAGMEQCSFQGRVISCNKSSRFKPEAEKIL